MKNKIKEKIMKQDMFGYIPNMNLNKNGDEHFTIIGAFISIIIKLLFTTYTILLLRRVINKSYDVNT